MRHDLHQLVAKIHTRLVDDTPRRLTPSDTCANTCARIGRTRPLFPKSRWKVSTGADDRVSPKVGIGPPTLDALAFGPKQNDRGARRSAIGGFDQSPPTPPPASGSSAA